MGDITNSLTTEKAQNFGSNVQTITSMEVAEMVGKQHKNLLADIRGYVSELGELNIQPTNFFC